MSPSHARLRHRLTPIHVNELVQAVNQCVGRAIRHMGDYAAIILVDTRYKSPAVRSKVIYHDTRVSNRRIENPILRL
jgi:Rad3-related DNA helicase